MRNHRRNRVAV